MNSSKGTRSKQTPGSHHNSKIYSSENKLYNEKHTKTVIDAERLVLNKKLADVKGDNTNMDREIQRLNMFNKKDEQAKARRLE